MPSRCMRTAVASPPAQFSIQGCPTVSLALQILQITEAEGPKEFSYDEEWLAILRSTHSLMSLHRRPVTLPGQLSLMAMRATAPSSRSDFANEVGQVGKALVLSYQHRHESEESSPTDTAASQGYSCAAQAWGH